MVSQQSNGKFCCYGNTRYYSILAQAKERITSHLVDLISLSFIFLLFFSSLPLT